MPSEAAHPYVYYIYYMGQFYFFSQARWVPTVPSAIAGEGQVQFSCCYDLRPVTLCNENLQVKIYGIKGILCDSLCHTRASMVRLFFFLLFSFLLNLTLFWKGSLQEQRVNTKVQGDEWNWDSWCERCKEKIKRYFKTKKKCI